MVSCHSNRTMTKTLTFFINEHLCVHFILYGQLKNQFILDRHLEIRCRYMFNIIITEAPF